MRSNSSIFHILSLIGWVSAHLLPSSGDKDLLFCCTFLWLIQLPMALAWIYKHTQWFECFIKLISLKSFEPWCSCSKINRQAKVTQGKKYQKIKKMKTAHFRDHPWKWNEMKWHVLQLYTVCIKRIGNMNKYERWLLWKWYFYCIWDLENEYIIWCYVEAISVFFLYITNFKGAIICKAYT